MGWYLDDRQIQPIGTARAIVYLRLWIPTNEATSFEPTMAGMRIRSSRQATLPSFLGRERAFGRSSESE